MHLTEHAARAFQNVNHYVLKCMARFLDRKSQRRQRLKYAETHYEELQELVLVARTRRRYCRK